MQLKRYGSQTVDATRCGRDLYRDLLVGFKNVGRRRLFYHIDYAHYAIA
jgi:hypothetical protein